MKIILSPAKKMISDGDFLPPRQAPVFLDQANQLRRYLQSLSVRQLQQLLACNDAIAALNYHRYQTMDLSQHTTPAILAYDGIQYQYMAPQVFDYDCLDYVERYVYILSGLYGVLRPFDGVVPYRLEMQAKLHTDFCSSLYAFWGDRLYREVTREDSQILNLASAEYSRTVLKYCKEGDRLVTCKFAELQDGKLREKGVYVKMARGEMVRFLAENRITSLEEVSYFDRLGYRYHAEWSDPHTFVFIRERTEH